MLRIPHPLTRGVATVGLAIGLVATSLTPALAGSQVPFTGSFTETFNFFSPPPIVATGGGNITHLGLSAESFQGTVGAPDPNKPGCLLDGATGTITGASGDVVDVTSAGDFCITSETATTITATDSGSFQINGGTGKFTGATGSGAYSSGVTIDLTTGGGTSNESYNGTISSPGSL